jgi:hypothetical protein
MIVPHDTMNFPREKPKFPEETYVPNLLAFTIIFFLYKLASFHWKGLKESYNFVGSTSIKT